MITIVTPIIQKRNHHKKALIETNYLPIKDDLLKNAILKNEIIMING